MNLRARAHLDRPMTPVQFVSCELAKWDERAADALVLSFFTDERPLRGAAGLADWRLCGRLSRLVKSGRVSGALGEATLLPPARGRLPFSRVFLFGLGPVADFAEAQYRHAVRTMGRTLERAGIGSFLMEAPGRALELIPARAAIAWWCEETTLAADLTLIESLPGQRDMNEVLREARG